MLLGPDREARGRARGAFEIQQWSPVAFFHLHTRTETAEDGFSSGVLVRGIITFMEPTTSQSQDSVSMVGTLPVIREHIVSTPETCGGKPRIAGSRIRVKDVVVWHERQGMTPAEIVSKWPHLGLSSIYAALAYYHDHREEINAELTADRSWYEDQRENQPSRLREALRGRVTDAPDDSPSS